VVREFSDVYFFTKDLDLAASTMDPFSADPLPDDDDVRFVLDQHGWLDFYSANSLKQQSAGRHVSPLEHFIPILTKPVFVLST
jgi:hypothetical protein